MTAAEGKILRENEKCLTADVCPQNPSGEFMMAAIFLNPRAIEFFAKRTSMMCLIAAKLDCTTGNFIHKKTQKIRAALNKNNTRGVMYANLSHAEIELYGHLMNVMKFGPRAGHLYKINGQAK